MSYIWLSNASSRPGVAGLNDFVCAGAIGEVPAAAAAGGITAIIVQIAIPGMTEGLDRDTAADLLEQADSLPPIWIFEAEAGASSAVRWIRAGAAQVHSTADELSRALAEAASERCATPDSGRRLIGEGPVFTSLLASMDSVAARRCNVLIEGETGTGKEVVAREIHESGPRKNAPFIAVNCAAIPDALLEAELFGHSKGAFTGAIQARAGKFEAANHGTIFLDEIGDMPLAIQAKLLRVIQEREIERLGGNTKVRLDVRIIAATNLDLAERVRQGLFRQDLYYRLNVFSIRIAPLRDRQEDIAALALHFVQKTCRAEGIAPKSIDSSALRRLESHDWPGNVRELENMIESAIIRSGSRPAISASDLIFPRAAIAGGAGDERFSLDLPAEGVDYQKAVEEFEHALLTQALTRTRGNKTAAASLLRLKRTTLSARMRAIEARFPRLVA